LPIYGYAIKGQPAIMEYIASNNRKRYSLLMAITNKGNKYYEIFEESINGVKFQNFVKNLDVPKGSILLLDNASIHKTQAFKNTVEDKKIQLLYTPPYTPEFNPIELSFGAIKNRFYKSRYFKNAGFRETIVNDTESIKPCSIVKTFQHVHNLIQRQKEKLKF
jgi:transposase